MKKYILLFLVLVLISSCSYTFDHQTRQKNHVYIYLLSNDGKILNTYKIDPSTFEAGISYIQFKDSNGNEIIWRGNFLKSDTPIDLK